MKKKKIKKLLGLFVCSICALILLCLPGKGNCKKPVRKDTFILIDPGHAPYPDDPTGGWDYRYWQADASTKAKMRTQPDTYHEQAYVYPAAYSLKASLILQGYKVELSKTKNEVLRLKDKQKLPNGTIQIIYPRLERFKRLFHENDNDVDKKIFISYHFNNPTVAQIGQVRGTEVYYRITDKNPERYKEYNETSQKLSENIKNRIVEVGFKDRGIHRSGFCVLSGLGAIDEKVKAACLIEVCYIDNQQDCEYYNAHKNEVTEAIVKGVIETIPPTNIGVVVTNVSPVGTVYSPGRPKISATLTSIDKNPATGLYENIVKSSIKMYVRKKYGPIVEPVPLNYDPDIEQADSFRIWHIPTSHLDYYEPYVVHVEAKTVTGKEGYLNWEFTLEPGKPVIFKTWPHGVFPKFVDGSGQGYSIPNKFCIGVISDCPKENIEVSMTVGGQLLTLTKFSYRGETTTVPDYKGELVPVYELTFEDLNTSQMDSKEYVAIAYARDGKFNLTNSKSWAFEIAPCSIFPAVSPPVVTKKPSYSSPNFVLTGGSASLTINSLWRIMANWEKKLEYGWFETIPYPEPPRILDTGTLENVGSGFFNLGDWSAEGTVKAMPTGHAWFKGFLTINGYLYLSLPDSSDGYPAREESVWFTRQAWWKIESY